MADSLATEVSSLKSVSQEGVMEKIIQRSTEHIDMAAKKEIPHYVWKTCKGIAIIDVTEFGLGFSVQEGGGLVMKHNEDGTWGAPSCRADSFWVRPTK